MTIKPDQQRELAVRLAGASHSRRIYASGSPIWQKTIESLRKEMDSFFAASHAEELSFALLGDNLAVAGVPILNAPAAVGRLALQMKARDVEIVSLKPECTLAEIETLLTYLTAEAADVSAVKGSSWLQERGVDHIEIKHLRLSQGAGGIESFRDVFRMGSEALGREFGRAAQVGTVDMGPIMELSQSLIQLILSADAPIATMLALRDRDDFTYIHSVNVGMLAGCQATAFGLSEKEAEAISIAGLLHDIGKSRVPEAILGKRTPLTLQEQALLAAHAQEGAKMLLASQGGSRLAAIVASEHHQTDHRAANGAPLFASQIVAIADTFDSLRSLRPFDDRNATRGALAYMLGRLSSRFNSYLLTRFATLCGMFDSGDLANLTTGEVVRVVTPHAESALHPIVEVVDTALGSLSAGTALDLSRQERTESRALQLPINAAFADLDPRELDWIG